MYFWSWELVANEFLHCSLRTSLPLPSPTLDQTLRRHNQELRTLQTNITRCVAGLCSAELGIRYVAVQMVPRYDTEWVS